MLFENKKEFIKYFIQLAMPVVIQQLLVNLLSISDTVMIGILGEDALSAVTVANKYFFIFNLSIFGISNGIGLFISQYAGAKDKKHYNLILRLGLKIITIASILFMIILFIYPDIVLKIFITDQEVIQLARQYNDIVRWSYLPFGLSQMLAVAYRVKGEANLPMKTGFISFIVNIILNYLLIYGKFGFPEMKVAGAALATLISRYIEMILLLLEACQKDDDYYLFNDYGNLKAVMIIDIFKRTLPLLINEFIWSLSLNMVFMNYCFVNEKYIPSLTAVDQVSNLVYVIFAGFSTAVGVVIGNELGAGQLDEAKKQAKTMIKIGLMIEIIGSAVIVLLSSYIPDLFSLKGSSKEMTILLLYIKCAFMWTQGYSETLYYIFRAGGDTTSVLCIDGIFTAVGPLLLSTVFSRFVPVDIMWLFAIVESVNVLKIVVATYFYKKETWVNKLTDLYDV